MNFSVGVQTREARGVVLTVGQFAASGRGGFAGKKTRPAPLPAPGGLRVIRLLTGTWGRRAAGGLSRGRPGSWGSLGDAFPAARASTARRVTAPVQPSGRREQKGCRWRAKRGTRVATGAESVARGGNPGCRRRVIAR